MILSFILVAALAFMAGLIVGNIINKRHNDDKIGN